MPLFTKPPKGLLFIPELMNEHGGLLGMILTRDRKTKRKPAPIPL
jgi:hypothetical protein